MSEASQDQNPEFVHRAFSSIAGRYVLTNHVLSLGVDVLWRRKVARRVAESSHEVILDVATGSGDLAATLRSRFPDSRIIGVDFCAPMLARARVRGLPDLLVGDGLALPFQSDSFDVVTVAYGLRNMANWAAALAEFRRVLKPGGRLLILDFSLPSRSWLRVPYRWYLHHLLPRLAGCLAGNFAAYRYLGESIERFPAGGAMRDLLIGQGFAEATAEPLWGGISSLYLAKRDATV